MFEFLAPIHRELGWMMPFETALMACGVLLLTIVYLALSRAQRFGRAPIPLIISACFGTALMVITTVALKQYDDAVANQASSANTPAATFSEVNIVLAAAAVFVITTTCAQIVVRVWRGSNRPTRAILVLGLVTLVSATLSIFAGCISYRFTPGTQQWTVFTNAKIYLRDIAFVCGVPFVIAVGLFFGLVIATIAAGGKRQSVTSNGGGSEM